MAGLFFLHIMFLPFFDSSGRSKSQGESISQKDVTAVDDVLKGLVEWLCAQVSISMPMSIGFF